jgi:phosphoglycerate dehydrogenase-like enzyme
VQYFARPFLEHGVQVVSVWAANAVPVAQFTLAQIILAAKGYFAAERLCRTPAGREAFSLEISNRYPGLFGLTVAILGAGMIGTRVIELLHDITQQPEDIHILVYDPFLSSGRAASLDVEVVSLEEAFERGQVISNHIADLPETRGMLTRELFARMPAHATFINTGRGATLDEAGMLAVMAERPDLTALLDVTYPEPPDPSSPIYALENVLLSPHIAGSVGPEVLRQADAVIEEWQRYRRGEPLRHAVSLEMLKTMA